MQLQVMHTLVFGVSQTTGNPAPVVFNADALTTQQMQAIAAHFGQETVFVLKPLEPAADIRLRYFVPRHEMEMCVHATVATITVLVRRHFLDKSPAHVETALGIIDAHWQPTTKEQILVMAEQFPPTWALPKNYFSVLSAFCS
ncbi:MAG: PhzF family phenazine biosynthesis isomerase [Anaerolineales bacterium]